MIPDHPEQPVAAARCCVFTIVSRNYLHFAFNLMDSVAEHMAGCRRVIVLCDASDGLPPAPEGVAFVAIDALGIAHVDRMAYQYTILELNTAIKPFAFARLFETLDVDSVVYFDPDIQLFSSGHPLLARLAEAEVVLTPHLTAPLDDDRHPSDLSILQSGTYNLGFLALRRSADTGALLRWWQAKLQRDCVVDIPRGLFTDQKWMDLVPGLFPRVHVERDAGWNVAYWNLLHRQVTLADDRFLVNGVPLFFFHFSGYSSGSRLISKHQDRFTMEACGPAVRELFSRYEQRLDGHGRARFSKLPYAFARLADGTTLPEAARQVIRSQIDWSQPLPDFGSAEGARFLIEFLTAPVDAGHPALSRLALQVHRARSDLQAAFPDVLGAHRQAFADWFASQATVEAGIGGALAVASGLPAQARTVAAPVAATPITTAEAAAPPAAGALPYRMAYKMAWRVRHLLRPFSTPALRARIRDHLIRRAYPPSRAAMAPPAQQGKPPWSFGVTVIGYVKAESGVGESARATLRALAHSGMPFSATDFRAGNVSRMGEAVADEVLAGRQHAVSLLHINADQLPLARTMLGDAVFAAPWRIGFWAWELENFPAEWQGAFDHVDEVWVPSTFCQQAVAAASPKPVLCMPHAVEVPARLQPDRARFGLRDDAVVFLAMADVLSSVERKNPFGAVDAFIAAFKGSQAAAQLVVKISNGERDPAAVERLRALALECPGLVLIDGYLDRQSLNSLIDSVDCFVSLHRAEGFGLVIAEAMARGKVVIATAWSGNMDFMNPRNSLPVDFQLRAIAADVGPYKRGQRWAEPVLADAVQKMRLIAADAPLRRRLGERARQDCEAALAPSVVGTRMAQRLQAIRAQRGL